MSFGFRGSSEKCQSPLLQLAAPNSQLKPSRLTAPPCCSAMNHCKAAPASTGIQITHSPSPVLQLLEMSKDDSSSSLSGNQKPMCKNGQKALWLLLLQGDHLQLLLQGLHKTGHMPSHGALMGISAGLFLPTTWLPDLGALSYVGALGVVSALGLTGGLALQQSQRLHCTSLTASTATVSAPQPQQSQCLNCVICVAQD